MQFKLPGVFRIKMYLTSTLIFFELDWFDFHKGTFNNQILAKLTSKNSQFTMKWVQQIKQFNLK